jgi:hypothetical protein
MKLTAPAMLACLSFITTLAQASPPTPAASLGAIHLGREQFSGLSIPYQRTHDGLAIVHGDIVAGSVAAISKQGIPQLGRIHRSNTARRSKRASWMPSSRTWPNNTVYYRQDQASRVVRQAVLLAMAEIEQQSAVRFAPHTGQAHYVNIRSPGPGLSGCFSALGYTASGAQTLQLSDDCAQNPSSVLHELLHALGLMHEHQRPDRDQYISVPASLYYNSDGSRAETSMMYDIIHDLDTSTPYDLDSVMHYPGLPVRPPYRLNPAQGKSVGTLSDGDIAALQRLYPSAASVQRSDPCQTPRQTYRNTVAYGEGAVVDYQGSLYQLRNSRWMPLPGCRSATKPRVPAARFSREHLTLSASSGASQTLWFISEQRSIDYLEKVEAQGVGLFGAPDAQDGKKRWEISLWPQGNYRGAGHLKVKVHFDTGETEVLTLPLTIKD